jgi:hypothetical protein
MPAGHLVSDFRRGLIVDALIGGIPRRRLRGALQFNGSVSLPVAGYNYNSAWTPLLAGLSPAGMAASLAARSFATDADMRLQRNI